MTDGVTILTGQYIASVKIKIDETMWCGKILRPVFQCPMIWKDVNGNRHIENIVINGIKITSPSCYKDSSSLQKLKTVVKSSAKWKAYTLVSPVITNG